MSIATTSSSEPWALLEQDPELDAALSRWTLDADLDSFVERERAVDGWIMLGEDLGLLFDLDAVIRHVTR